jgi:hypothetical protein
MSEPAADCHREIVLRIVEVCNARLRKNIDERARNLLGAFGVHGRRENI